MSRIFFYCPSHKMGGEQMLFIRCAIFLSESGYQVSYIDYEDGFSSQFFSNTNVIIEKYQKRGIVAIPSKSVIIIALSHIDRLPLFFGNRNDLYYLLWSIQPYNLVGKIFLRSGYSLIKPLRRYLGNLVKSLYTQGVIKFMDYNNYYPVHKALGLDIQDINYLQIPIDDSQIIKESQLKELQVQSNPIRFLWISRIDPDKEPMLLTIMNELNELSSKYNVKFVVVGDGKSLEDVKSYASSCNYEIKFMGRKSGEDLNRIIDNDIDIGIAMGTSALEISKRGKPVIMTTTIPKFLKAGVIDDYILLHQEYGYSLDKPNVFTEGQGTFPAVFEKIIGNYQKYGQLDYDYTVKNHSMSNVGQRLIECIQKLLENDTTVINKDISKVNNVLRVSKIVKLSFLRHSS